MSWTHANLETQGYCLSEDDARSLRLGLRFPTALCLLLVVTGLALESALMIALLVPVGAIAGWTSRHPFDLIWNHGLRHIAGLPELPRNPTRRRHAFKLATVWLGVVAVLFAVGATTAALVLGGVLVAVCTLVTVTNFCIPSTMLAWMDSRSPVAESVADAAPAAGAGARRRQRTDSTRPPAAHPVEGDRVSAVTRSARPGAPEQGGGKPLGIRRGPA